MMNDQTFYFIMLATTLLTILGLLVHDIKGQWWFNGIVAAVFSFNFAFMAISLEFADPGNGGPVFEMLVQPFALAYVMVVHVILASVFALRAKAQFIAMSRLATPTYTYVGASGDLAA